MDAYASWTLFFIFVSILILISGVVLLTHKKPESPSAQRDGIALNAVPNRQIPRTIDGKADGHEDVDIEEQGEEQEPVVWDVGDVSDEEDADIMPASRPQSLAEASHGEEGELLMASSPDDGDDMHSHTAATDGRPQTRRRSSSSVLRRDNDKDRDDEDGFGDFAGA